MKFFLTLPNTKSAIETIEELKELGVKEDHIHIISQESSIAAETHTCRATDFHKTDAWHMGVQGLVIGAVFAAESNFTLQAGTSGPSDMTVARAVASTTAMPATVDIKSAMEFAIFPKT